jgi:hypothetical protein
MQAGDPWQLPRSEGLDDAFRNGHDVPDERITKVPGDVRAMTILTSRAPAPALRAGFCSSPWEPLGYGAPGVGQPLGSDQPIMLKYRNNTCHARTSIGLESPFRYQKCSAKLNRVPDQVGSRRFSLYRSVIRPGTK